jgi:hypothetical protein
MQTFKAQRWERAELWPEPSVRGHRFQGIRAPGPIVLVVQEGSGWVQRQDGGREVLNAKSVVIYKTGDWFEYGTDSGDEFTIETYWAADLSEEEWKAIFTETFGPDFSQ